MLTSRQVREACEMLRWNRYDLQRRTGLPLHAVDRAMAAEAAVEATLAHETVFKGAFHCAGIEFAPQNDGTGVRLRPYERQTRTRHRRGALREGDDGTD